MKQLSPKPLLVTLSIIAMVAYSFIVYAAAPTGGYTSGQTLNPNCAPGDTDCVVRQPWLMNTADGYVYNTDSMVGIGTDTPTAALDVVGDVAFDTTASGAHLRSVQGALGSFGGDRGVVQYVGDDMSLFGVAKLDYSLGDPSYNLYLTNGVHTLNFLMDSATGETTMNASKISLNSESSISTDRQSFISVDTNGHAPGEPNVSLFATADNAITFSNISANSDSALMFVSTLSTGNAASGTPLVIQVSDENTRGGGFSARSRSLSYDHAGADMFVWDQALGGDRTWMWMDETKIDTGLLLDPLIPGAANYTTNNITEISFEYHNGDPTLSNNSLYKINADFIWSKPATLGEVMRLDGTTGRLSVSSNAASNYAASFFNDGNNTNRYGVKIQAGADDCSSTGTCNFIDFFDGDGTAAGGVRIVNGTVGTYNPSDMRLKTNIRDTSLSGLATIDALRVTDFQRTSGGTLGPVQTGFIAQEVQQTYPAMVAPTPDGYLAISEGMLIPVLVKAVQELDVKMRSIETFADNYNASLLDHLKTWFADAGNGVTLIVANVFKSQKVETEQLCVGSTCVTETQLQQLLNQNQVALQPAPEPQASPSDENMDSQGDSQEAPQDVPTQEEVVPQLEPVPEPAPEAPAQDPLPQE